MLRDPYINCLLYLTLNLLCFLFLGADKPTDLEFVKTKCATPLTPTGYTQPPTPDFPPPSPTTAMLGIELKIQQIVSIHWLSISS